MRRQVNQWYPIFALTCHLATHNPLVRPSNPNNQKVEQNTTVGNGTPTHTIGAALQFNTDCDPVFDLHGNDQALYCSSGKGPSTLSRR